MIEWLADLGAGIVIVFQFKIFLASAIGVFFGAVIGIIPGLGPAVAISVAIPLTYSLGAIPAIALMLGIYKGGVYGGSISAIMINTPGTPAAAATVLDGYPLALQGKSGKALDTALFASVFGDAFGVMLLIMVAQAIAAIALMFGPAELSMLIVFSLVIISSLSGKSLLMGVMATGLGLALSTVKLDPIIGLPRFCFGFTVLEDGFPLIPLVIGIFAVAEVLKQSEKIVTRSRGSLLPPPSTADDAHMTWKEFKSYLPIFSLSSLIGVCIGALPGTGSVTSAYLSYGLAQKRSKHPELFGKGATDGLAAAESGNNAACGGALIPMLTLGVPGDVITAILMGALMVHGIHVGPMIFVDHRVFVFGIFGVLLVSILMLLIIGKVLLRGVRHLAHMPISIIMPIVMVLCVIGAYSSNYSVTDIWFMLAFGVIGYLFNKIEFPLPPFLIAFVLGPQFELYIRQALMLSRGDFSVFFTKPICLLFICLSAFAACQIILMRRKNKAVL